MEKRENHLFQFLPVHIHATPQLRNNDPALGHTHPLIPACRADVQPLRATTIHAISNSPTSGGGLHEKKNESKRSKRQKTKLGLHDLEHAGHLDADPSQIVARRQNEHTLDAPSEIPPKMPNVASNEMRGPRG